MDLDLRAELERDVQRLRDEVDRFTWIVVSGDIAFGGRSEEYVSAREWLNTLTNVAGCEADHVWLVPGNHDIDRDIAGQGKLLPSFRRELREAAPAHIETTLASWMQDPAAAPHLLAAQRAYLEFAASYGCVPEKGHLHWDRDLILDDGSTLRVRGINSAVVSDATDNDGANRLVVDQMQLTIPRGPDDSVQYLLMSHHPPDWLHNRDVVEDYMKRARIQLFGHKHRAHVDIINNSLRLTAGAVHPSRAEQDWEPRFNAIRISTWASGGQRRLRADVYARKWSEDDTAFIPVMESSSTFRRIELDLPQWSAPAPDRGALSPEPLGEEKSADILSSVAVDAKRSEVNARQRLTYRFFSLSFLGRIDVARGLGLLRESDEGISGEEFGRRIFQRARDERKLEQLWAAVETRFADPANNNPYKGM